MATAIYCDNINAVYISSNPIQHRYTKHIEIDIHSIREVSLRHVQVLHVLSSLQFVDIMTKGLPTYLFKEFQTSLCIRHPHDSTAGVLEYPFLVYKLYRDIIFCISMYKRL